MFHHQISVVLTCSLVLLLFHIFRVSTALDTITTTQYIKDGDGETLVSAGGNFELGFFSPGRSSSKRYLGIWYRNMSTQAVVWVGNRDTPLNTTSGVLELTALGRLTLLNGTNGTAVWSSNTSTSDDSNTQQQQQQQHVALLLETGNLVVREETTKKYVWQSFDYPGDTFLPGMKLGRSYVTGLEWHLSSWKSSDDPGLGEYTYSLVTQGPLHMVIRRVGPGPGSIRTYRSGPSLNGEPLGRTPLLNGGDSGIYETKFVSTDEEVYYTYVSLNTSSSVHRRVVLSHNGDMLGLAWNGSDWTPYTSLPANNCDTYALCGPYGICNANEAPLCGCLEGFQAKYPDEPERGCVRRTEVSCPGDQGFLPYSGIKLPDTEGSRYDREMMNVEDCRKSCLENCSCVAFSSFDGIAGYGTGCLLWFGDLLDIKVYTAGRQNIYIRMASAEIDAHLYPNNLHPTSRKSSNRKKLVVIAVGCILGILLLLGLAASVHFWRKKRQSISGKLRYTFENPKECIEVPMFKYSVVLKATNNFSTENKLGEGGFGPVYKGKLEGEQDIAVKILSEDSRQGLSELKNEVLFIAKLQHRNLVKLLGCCIKKRKMLIYEYMPNKSLDYFIFDEERRVLLDWPKRMHIINGISRGLLYLHQDSRLRIIHRDLKASNILLDHEMNPKISDFGLARIFHGDEIGENTKRVVGTHGYMSPEYAVDGLFSTKSDIFSFGVLVLEIVSGKRNWGFNHPDHNLNLLGHAWKLNKEGRPLDLVDSSLALPSDSFEVTLLISLGLLCVQRNPEDRPSIAGVIQMMGGESEILSPKQPGFFNERNPCGPYSSTSNYSPCSSITALLPR